MQRKTILMRSCFTGAAAAAVLALSATAQERPKHLILTGIPSATIAPSGMGFAQISGTTENHNDKTDGSIALGFGLGDARETVGLQAALNVTSLSDDFGDSGHLSLKLSRALTDGLYAGLEVSHLGGWGDAEDVDPTVAAMLTYFGLVSVGGGSYPFILTAGVGERMRWDDTEAKTAGFIGVGVGLTEHIAASLAYTGNDWEIGLGARIGDGITLSASVEDVFDQNEDRKLVLSATYAFNFLGR